MKKLEKQTEAEKREEALDQKLDELSKTGDWAQVLKELDRYDENNERRHESHRAYIDISLTERDNSWVQGFESPPLRLRDSRKLSRCEDWIEIIFSQKAEDIHELVEDRPISLALRELTLPQKEVLLENVVYDVKTKDLARQESCSVRNITKRRKTALDKVNRLRKEYE